MIPIKLKDVNITEVYIFRINGISFIGKLLYIHKDEIAIQDLLNHVTKYIDPSTCLDIYEYNQIAIRGIPFAYNGPCATVSGVGRIYNKMLNTYGALANCKLFHQNMNQSAVQYLDSILYEVSDKEVNKAIFLGGNHLSVLPLHQYAKQNKLCAVVLDAHRDYSFNSDSHTDEFTHANFFNWLGDLSNVLFYGYRDGRKNTYLNCKTYQSEQLADLLVTIDEFKKEGYQFYVDIDLDVLDPACFPATACPLEGGITPKQLLEILNHIGYDLIKYISLVEYIPFLDDDYCDNDHCFEIIIKMLKEIIKGWNHCECYIDNS